MWEMNGNLVEKTHKDGCVCECVSVMCQSDLWLHHARHWSLLHSAWICHDAKAKLEMVKRVRSGNELELRDLGRVGRGG